jgi:hypothetical protein
MPAYLAKCNSDTTRPIVAPADIPYRRADFDSEEPLRQGEYRIPTSSPIASGATQVIRAGGIPSGGVFGGGTIEPT